MSLTPIDIRHTHFRTSFRGYNKSDVDEFINSVTNSLEDILAENNQLKKQISIMQDEIDRIRQIESTMTEALTLAQKTATELKETAYKQAENILKEAESSRIKLQVDSQKQVESLRAEIKMLEDTKNRFEAEFRAVLTTYLDWLNKTQPNTIIIKEQIKEDEELIGKISEQ
ncbi:MAG: DivIVA domain-containing protein [Armatimonadota bacterium]